MLELSDGAAALVTIHPSFLLRIQDAADKKREYAHFVADLRLAAKILAKDAGRAAIRHVA
jgi:uracil-DNA glycosylase